MKGDMKPVTLELAYNATRSDRPGLIIEYRISGHDTEIWVPTSLVEHFIVLTRGTELTAAMDRMFDPMPAEDSRVTLVERASITDPDLLATIGVSSALTLVKRTFMGY